MKTTTYRISSNNDARMSSLHGETYDTYEGAEADVRRVGPEDLVLESVDHGNEQAWLVYADQDDADADANGAAPHKCIARIETVTG